ncbi:peroxiredoxin [Paenibacillus kobensis]|uniref:peroxiredoxin n=1 Tax=Paenibacillus kobensis TaxID=59841 RepID=UPI000FDB55FC|nr:redoxin domain-containing protein [Paenibacillus kobensis]
MLQLQSGDQASPFHLEGVELGKRKLVNLDEYIGQYVILLFYPRNFTVMCTTQHCKLRDHYESIQSAVKPLGRVVIIGISPDLISSHLIFSRKNRLPHILLSDPDGVVARRYGIKSVSDSDNDSVAMLQRITYLINPSGMIIHRYEVTNIEEHITQLEQDLRTEMSRN